MEGVYFRGEPLDTDALRWDADDPESFIGAVARFAVLNGETDVWLVFDCPADAPDSALDEADTAAIWIGAPPDPALVRGRRVDRLSFRGELN